MVPVIITVSPPEIPPSLGVTEVIVGVDKGNNNNVIYLKNRFWVGGNGVWDNSTTTNWSATDGGAGGVDIVDWYNNNGTASSAIDYGSFAVTGTGVTLTASESSSVVSVSYTTTDTGVDGTIYYSITQLA